MISGRPVWTMRSLSKRANVARRSAVPVTELCGEPSEARMGRMAAWRIHSYGGLDELRLDQARVPPLRSPSQLLVRVRTASINPIDTAMIGGYGVRLLGAARRLHGEAEDGLPLVTGRDFVGDVVLAGPGAHLSPADRIWGVVPPYCSGTHAQFALVEDRWVGPAPAALDDVAAGGALYAALTATAALRAAGLVPAGPSSHKVRRARPRVLILGLGGVGYSALQLLVHQGAQVVVGCADTALEQAAALGAQALDRHDPEYERHLCDAGPYDVILDCAGLGGSHASERPWRYKRYVTLTTPLLRSTDSLGLVGGLATTVAHVLRQQLAARQQDSCEPRVRWAFFSPRSDDIEMLRRLADAGKFRVQVEQVFPYTEGLQAYKRAQQGHARGKLLLDFTREEPLR